MSVRAAQRRLVTWTLLGAFVALLAGIALAASHAADGSPRVATHHPLPAPYGVAGAA